MCLTPIPGHDVVTLVGTAGGRASVEGVRRCKSPTSCANCSPVMAASRAEVIEAGLSAAVSRGHEVWFVTFTLSHSVRMRFGLTADRLRDSYRSMTDRRDYKQLRERVGIEAYVRCLDTTWGGANGWHPHYHCAFITRAGAGFDEETIRQLGTLWSNAVDRKGGRATIAHGVDVRRCENVEDIGKYATKTGAAWGVGSELTRTDVKRDGTTPFTILTAAVAGDKTAAFLWHDYEHGVQDHRAISFSRSWAEVTGVEDLTDDEAIEGELDGAHEVRMVLTKTEYLLVLGSGRLGLVLDELVARAIREVDVGAVGARACERRRPSP